MSFIKISGQRRRLLNWIIGSLMVAVITLLLYVDIENPEIVLTLGDTYEEMRERSSVNFSPLIRGHLWGGIPKSDARLRFRDPQYGFVTEPARFLMVMFDDNIIQNVRLSPQVEPLLLDDALKIALDLQSQWRTKGWVLSHPAGEPAFEDTPQWRERLRGVLGGRTFWRAGDKYQTQLLMSQFTDIKHPNEERYLITLEVSRQWLPSEDAQFEVQQNLEAPCPMPCGMYRCRK